MFPARSSHRQESPQELIMIPLDFLNVASRTGCAHTTSRIRASVLHEPAPHGSTAGLPQGPPEGELRPRKLRLEGRCAGQPKGGPAGGDGKK
ncbi:hypothetical protein A0H81_08685 [Grifola frondosa]|uniref:Uncharacterized protein n=1 Tax=Grifola frondosa TaxID=5627 RepID=A0A1C7M4E8_GRIFR|nr:hypothetical protein A0H81_08685 [Grifola frondosa]